MRKLIPVIQMGKLVKIPFLRELAEREVFARDVLNNLTTPNGVMLTQHPNLSSDIYFRLDSENGEMNECFYEDQQ